MQLFLCVAFLKEKHLKRQGIKINLTEGHEKNYIVHYHWFDSNKLDMP
jgi:hypothetical protein